MKKLLFCLLLAIPLTSWSEISYPAAKDRVSHAKCTIDLNVNEAPLGQAVSVLLEPQKFQFELPTGREHNQSQFRFEPIKMTSSQGELQVQIAFGPSSYFGKGENAFGFTYSLHMSVFLVNGDEFQFLGEDSAFFDPANEIIYQTTGRASRALAFRNPLLINLMTHTETRNPEDLEAVFTTADKNGTYKIGDWTDVAVKCDFGYYK